MDGKPRPHLERTRTTWEALQHYRQVGSIVLDGHSLDIAGVVAVSRYGCKPSISKDPELVEAVNQSVDTLHRYLADGSFLYGVNTGFGGSADVRTKDLLSLQVSLIQHTQSGIIPGRDYGGDGGDGDDGKEGHIEKEEDELASYVMPRAWVRGAMATRANSNIRGHSALKLAVAEAVAELVARDCTPLVPLRGSISASGDLMPLSYVAGALMGNPDVRVRVGRGRTVVVLPADKALHQLGLRPTVLGAKEGLSLINGTAPSAAVAALVIHDADRLAVLGQLLTAMTAEGLAAGAEWAHPFIADVRPHSGQIEAAANIRSFLCGSHLVTGLSSLASGRTAKDRFRAGIAQERYALRTAPQWLSPVLEDLALARQQVETELNATTDNPLVDVAASDVYSGGNFQAATVAAATDKARWCLQMLGKLLFSQTTELIGGPAVSGGLPPNLAADDPSLSFCCKGIDVNLAAYQAELSYLAGPVTAHVQSAEMHNQSVNSLALVSARYAMQAVELVSLMCAGALYTTCQALDLRVLHASYLEEALRPPLMALLREHLIDNREDPSLLDVIWKEICKAWYETASFDAPARASQVAAAVVPKIVEAVGSRNNEGRIEGLKSLQTLREDIGRMVLDKYVAHRDAFFHQQTTAKHLGQTTRRCYKFVRCDLGVPFHQGLVEQPQPGGDAELDGRPKRTIGSWVSILYEAVRDGRLIDHIFRESREINRRDGPDDDADPDGSDKGSLGTSSTAAWIEASVAKAEEGVVN